MMQLSKIKLWPFFVWLACFYTVWLFIIITGNYWRTLAEHYGIAIAMAFGSYVAGSTPMGGGTVGFPILVLLFDLPATLGRDFSFAVQSIGMTSASIFILSRRQPLAWTMLKWAMIGSLFGTPLGILFVAPYVPVLWIKLVFAVLWASFGVLHLYRLNAICANEGETQADERFERNAGLAIGLLGGATITAITGVGIDMLIYTILVLLCAADLKIAIPTSVLLMAFNSLVGIATKNLFTGVQPGVFENWLAAAPIVALGAPFGALIVAKVGRRPTLFLVALLCIGQFLWTLYEEQATLGNSGVLLAFVAVLLCNAGFEWLFQLGHQIARRVRSRSETVAV